MIPVISAMIEGVQYHMSPKYPRGPMMKQREAKKRRV